MPSFCLSPFLQCGERKAKEEGEVWHGGSPEGNMKPFSNMLCTAPALGCCIRTIYCSATQGNSATRGCLSRHEASCPGCCSPSFSLPLPCPSLSTQFDCQKHVKGVVVIGLQLWGKKLETIESNSFARNHRRVKLRDNIVSCLSQ